MARRLADAFDLAELTAPLTPTTNGAVPAQSWMRQGGASQPPVGEHSPQQVQLEIQDETVPLSVGEEI